MVGNKLWVFVMVGLEEFGSGLEVPVELQLHLVDLDEAGKTCQQSKLDGFPSKQHILGN